jgi:hypothetical protein
MTFGHPHPAAQRWQQRAAFALTVVLLLAALACAGLALAFGLPLMILAAVFLVGLGMAALLPTVSAPAVTIADEALTVQPLLWRETRARWADVRLREYTMLPPAGAEVGRKALVGRGRYRPAEGVLLIVPGLPAVFRVHGFFAGVGFMPAIALTNRTHAQYDRLLREVKTRLHADALQFE